jgi:hypothetical protein
LNLRLVCELAVTCDNLNTLKFLRKLRRRAINLLVLAIRLNGTNASYRKLPQENLLSRFNGALG